MPPSRAGPRLPPRPFLHTSCLPQTVPGSGSTQRAPQHPQAHCESASGAWGLARPSHCPLLSDPPQNGPWCCRHGRLWARAPRGHWMTPPLQDPATYDSRPSAPTRRGTGRCCFPQQPGSRSPGAPLRAGGSQPLVTLHGPPWHFCPRLDPWQCLFSSPVTAGASSQTLLPATATVALPLAQCPLTSHRPWALPLRAIADRDE